MADLNSFMDAYGPTPKAAIYGIAGFLLNTIWLTVRGRRIAVTWTAIFQPIKPLGVEPTNTKIAVLVNETPAPNLQTCSITVTNDSARDIEKMDLLFTFYDPFAIVDSTANLTASAKNLLHSEKYHMAAKAVMDTPEPQRGAHVSLPYILRNREFHLPSLNRGESATFLFWINSSQPTAAPRVLVTSEKAGVVVVSKRADLRWLDYKLIKATASLGIIIAILLGLLISQTDMKPTTMCVVAAVSGSLAGVLAIALIQIGKFIRRTV